MMNDYLIINTADQSISTTELLSYSGCKQDAFVIELLKHKRDGFYVDIGSAHCYDNNNSFLLEKQYNWKGICVEFESRYNNSYTSRNCRYVNGNALEINYPQLFQETSMPTVIDYLSLDIDAHTTPLLAIIPFDRYQFRVITIEHDHYLHGAEDRNRQREILQSRGYHLLFGDVFVEMKNFDKEKPFEDWWIHPNFFDATFIQTVTTQEIYPSQAIERVRHSR